MSETARATVERIENEHLSCGTRIPTTAVAAFTAALEERDRLIERLKSFAERRSFKQLETSQHISQLQIQVSTLKELPKEAHNER